MYRHEQGTESPLHKWMRIHLAEDDEDLVRILREVGFLRPGVPVDVKRMMKLFERSGDPVQTELFKFDGDYLRETLERMTASMTVGLSLAFPPDFIHAQRALGIGIGVLCQLEAEVPFRDEAVCWLTAEDSRG